MVGVSLWDLKLAILAGLNGNLGPWSNLQILLSSFKAINEHVSLNFISSPEKTSWNRVKANKITSFENGKSKLNITMKKNNQFTHQKSNKTSEMKSSKKFVSLSKLKYYKTGTCQYFSEFIQNSEKVSKIDGKAK